MPTFKLGFAPSKHRSDRPGYNGTSLQDFFAAFPNDSACLAHVFRTRFGHNPVCQRCGGTEGWQPHAKQKHYFHSCGGIFSPMAGTIFSKSRIPLQLWFYAMLHFANSAESIATPFLARQTGVSNPTAFRMSHRIRLQMAALDNDVTIGGAGKIVMARLVKVLRIINYRNNAQNSAMVFLLSDNKRVNCTLVVKPRQKTLRHVIKNKIDPQSILATDCYWTHKVLSNYSSGKPISTFLPEYFFDAPPHENLNHGFMQYFHLSFADQFRGVSLENAWLYLKEYEFRYNRRHVSACTFPDMISQFPSFDSNFINKIKLRNFASF